MDATNYVNKINMNRKDKDIIKKYSPIKFYVLHTNFSYTLDT